MPKITFVKTGQTFEVEAGTSFLEFCQENDAPHPFGCTVGSCGACALVFDSGAENVNAATDEEKEVVEMCCQDETSRLGCQLVVNGDIAIRSSED